MSGLARGLKAKWCALPQRQGQDRKVKASLLPKSREMRDHHEAGLLIRGSHQIQEQGGRKEGNVPDPGWEQRKEGKPVWRGSHLLGNDHTNGALRGVCGQAQVVFRERWMGQGVTQGSS